MLSLQYMYIYIGNRNDKLLELFNNMELKYGVKPDASTYASILSSFGRKGNYKKALFYFKQMESLNIDADIVCYNSLFNACGKGLSTQY